jgi:histone H3/H4
LGLHDNARFKYEAHQFQEELFVPEEARLGANADFEAGSPLFFFCESKAAYDKVLAKQGPRCGAAECQKFSIFAESWCQEHKAEMESKELEERTKEAVMLRGEDGDMPVTEATMHAASLALIRKMQSSVESVLPFKVVAALVVRLGVEFQNDLQFEPAAICILAKLLECYLVGLLEDSLLSSIRGLRRCVIAEDVTLAKRMRGGRTTS